MTNNPDTQHLRLLTLFHYICAGLAALVACFPIIHLVLGIVIVTRPAAFDQSNPPPAIVGWMFIAAAAFIILFGLALAVAIAVTGRCLDRRRHYTFCLIMAGVECLFMPVGTVLGVFTLLILNRPSVRELFNRGVPAATVPA